MSDQPTVASQSQQPVISVVSAADLIQQTITRLPALIEVKRQLELVFGVFVQFVNTPAGQVDSATATAALEAFFETDPNGVRLAVIDIGRVVNTISIDIAQRFKDLTGTELDPKTLNITGRVQDEIEEQQSLDKIARELLVVIQAICTKLGVRDLYTERRQADEAERAKKGQKSILQTLQARIVDTAIEKGLMTPIETPAELGELEPDWLTPPVLKADDPDVARVQKKLTAITGLMATYSAQPNMKDYVLGALANMKMPVVELEKLLDHASELAQQQISQSKKILADVGEDQSALAEEIDAVSDVKEVYGAVLRYFFPQK